MPTMEDRHLTRNSVTALVSRIRNGALNPAELIEQALKLANTNPSKNTYLELRPDDVWAQLDNLRKNQSRLLPLFGVPVSIKDCFDVQNYSTSSGSRFYRERNGRSMQDSALVRQLRAAGAIIIGKTHLHQLAYGITGENRDFGDCLQAGHPDRLTGGSSSGAASSVLEGSALLGIGTDTGGSIRVPASLCGLSGYRASLGVGSWEGGRHLAESFDTIGWLFRFLSDATLLGAAILGIKVPALEPRPRWIGAISAEYVADCEQGVKNTFAQWRERFVADRHQVKTFEPEGWEEASEIFAGIQAYEAAGYHRGHFDKFEAPIAERLRWGASLSISYIDDLRRRLKGFVVRIGELFQRYDFLLLPCAPVSELRRRADHRAIRPVILRYTTPASLAGCPVVVLPGGIGGCQLVAPRGADGELLAFAVELHRPNSAV